MLLDGLFVAVKINIKTLHRQYKEVNIMKELVDMITLSTRLWTTVAQVTCMTMPIRLLTSCNGGKL